MGKQKCYLLHTEHEKGIALITALLLLVLMSALAVAVVYKVNYEQHLQGTDSGNNVAFYGAEAGMEKMVADLNALYKAQAAPGCNDIAKLYQSAQEPSSSDVGVGYSQYTITLPDGTDLSSCTVPPYAGAGNLARTKCRTASAGCALKNVGRRANAPWRVGCHGSAGRSCPNPGFPVRSFLRKRP